MGGTPKLDKVLLDAEAAAANQTNPDAIEHVIVAMLRRAKSDPELASELERISDQALPAKTSSERRTENKA